MDEQHNTPSLSHQQINAQCGCFSLRKASRAVTQHFDHALEPSGLRATQFTLLVTLSSVSARTLTDMANVLVMDRTTLTRNLKPLQKMELIQEAAAKDKRSRAYSLSEKGRAVLSQSIPLWHQAQKRLSEGLGEERFSRLRSELLAVTKLISE